MQRAFKPAGQVVSGHVTRLVNRTLQLLPDEWEAVTVYQRFAPSPERPGDFIALIRAQNDTVSVPFDVRLLSTSARDAAAVITAAARAHFATKEEATHGC